MIIININTNTHILKQTCKHIFEECTHTQVHTHTSHEEQA